MPPSLRRLDGKIALITGGGTGIGRAIAHLFAEEGARVCVAGRRSEPLQKVVAEIRERGGTATFTRGDVSRLDRVELMVQGAVFNFGGLDILVNNAGILLTGAITDTDEKRWDKVLGTNLKGAYMVSRCAVPALAARGGGVILNNACVHGIAARKDAAAYCASKGGLVQLTRAMALDHAPDHIRVNAICPGPPDGIPARDGATRPWLDPVLKDYPVDRAATPEEVARLALYLASQESGGMTGAAMPFDSGFTVG